MATEESFPPFDERSRLLDLIQGLMITPVHDQIGAIKEEVNLAIRLAAEAELKSTSTDRNVQEELAGLRSGLSTLTGVVGQLAFSYYTMQFVLREWIGALSVFATLYPVETSKREATTTLQLVKLFEDFLTKYLDLAKEATSVPGPEKAAEMSARTTAATSEFLSGLRSTLGLAEPAIGEDP